MTETAVGVIVLAIGLLCCFSGQAAFRGIMSIWGGLIGFVLGAAAVSAVTGQAPLHSVFDWAAAVVGAVVVGAAAYGFYRLGVVIALGSIGYAFGTSIAASYVGVGDLSYVVGLVLAVLVAIVALIADLPTILLVVATSIAGATATVTGLRLLTGTVSIPVLVDRGVAGVGGQWWWTAAWVALAVAGITVQSRMVRGRTARE